MSKIESVNPYEIPESKTTSIDKSQQTNPGVKFEKFFNELSQNPIMASAQKEASSGNYTYIKPVIEFDEDGLEREELIAQGTTADDILPIFREVEQRRQQRERDQENRESEFELMNKRYEVTPFQMFINKSIEVLENISKLEYKVNDLTEQFIRGEVSVDEVSIEVTKLNLAISFVTTVISSASQTFKEITQMQI